MSRRVPDGESSDALSVGKTVTVGGSDYTLNLNGGILNLTKASPRE